MVLGTLLNVFLGGGGYTLNRRELGISWTLFFFFLRIGWYLYSLIGFAGDSCKRDVLSFQTGLSSCRATRGIAAGGQSGRQGDSLAGTIVVPFLTYASRA